MMEGTSNHPMGRDHLPWTAEIWQRIEARVTEACTLQAPASDFLPKVGPDPRAVTRDSDVPLAGEPPLSVDEAATVPLIESWVEFALTPQQVAGEAESMAACTLAARAANLLTQARDLLIFQGDTAVAEDPLFTEHRVRVRSGPAGSGLFFAVPEDDAARTLGVQAREPGLVFAERTFEAVTAGCARLQGEEHYGPYCLVLHTVLYGDTFAPLATTLLTPAERLEPILEAGFLESGALPPLRGLLISLGGNSLDLVVGREPTVSFLQQDPDGKSRFRVWQRFALRLKDPSALLRLDFLPDAADAV